MTPTFDHEKLRAYQEALRFVRWVGPILEQIPSRLAAKDQLDRASTSIALNLAEGNGKRSTLERCRFFDIARGSTVESTACLDILVARGKIAEDVAAAGKAILQGVVAMTAGLIARFSNKVEEGAGSYAQSTYVENENE